MRKILIISMLFCMFALRVDAQEGFDRYFENKALRIDFDLSGNKEYQAGAIRLLREETVWSGPKNHLIDNFGYGNYYINIYSPTGELIYCRGFNTLFEEWRTTKEALTEIQSWTHSISIPYPKQHITAEITARDWATGRFEPLIRMDIDPQSIYIDRSPLKSNTATSIEWHGISSEKVDLVFLAEGYTQHQQEKFIDDVKRFTELLFSTAPFDGHRQDFNIWAVGTVSEDPGTDISGEGIFKNTALNSGFYTFGSERYLTTRDMTAVRNAVWDVPCDALFIMVNSEKYGGGGMYNMYAIGTADNERTAYVFVHELGHSFAGLADEYFEKDTSYNDFYNLAIEPWQSNITTLVDFNSKWNAWLPEGTPIPTPLTEDYKYGLGVFEGGGYVSKGIYRPVDHCMMRDFHPFCPVCSGAIVRMIDYYCGRPY